MTPVVLYTERLRLNQPGLADIDLITEYCQDPLFKQFVPIPWPYLRAHAVWFVTDFVPERWQSNNGEATWAIRLDGMLIGVICVRFSSRDIGYWLGRPFRGQGYLTEALTAVTQFAFDELSFVDLKWQAVLGNLASARVARAAGFKFCGTRPSSYELRFGAESWHAVRTATVDTRDAASWYSVLG